MTMWKLGGGERACEDGEGSHAFSRRDEVEMQRHLPRSSEGWRGALHLGAIRAEPRGGAVRLSESARGVHLGAAGIGRGEACSGERDGNGDGTLAAHGGARRRGARSVDCDDDKDDGRV